MKRIFILLTLMACMTGVHAQETDDDYLPLLAEGKVWTQNVGEIPRYHICFYPWSPEH